MAILLISNFFFLIPIAIVIAIILIIRNSNYKKGQYYRATQSPYLSVRYDKGKYGEYLIYKQLQCFENTGGRFLFNIYIPQGDNKTTEIDVLLICSKGIFVFESKNYSGWIFGNEYQKSWTQTLPQSRGYRSRKEHFYNPIMQNKTHIKYLRNYIDKSIPVHSVIVFSERCILKNVTVKSNDVRVINRYNILPVVCSICNQIQTDILNQTEINEIYNKLYPFTQVSEKTKMQHIENIRRNLNPLNLPPSPAPTPSFSKSAIVTPSRQTERPVAGPVQSPILSAGTGQTIDEPNICPKCGGNLIIKTARRGQNASDRFYGCSNFPKCNYAAEFKQEENPDF